MSDTIVLVIVALSNGRRSGAQLQRRVIDMGSRGTNRFEEPGHNLWRRQGVTGIRETDQFYVNVG
jgi:hypothetical protein